VLFKHTMNHCALGNKNFGGFCFVIIKAESPEVFIA